MKIFIGKDNSCYLNYQKKLLYSSLYFNNFNIVGNPEEADIIIFSDTCCCTAFNMNVTLAYINEILKRKKKDAKTFLTGCMTRTFKKNIDNFDLNGWLEEHIDYIIPQNNVNEILKMISEEIFKDVPNDDFGFFCPASNEVADLYISNGCMNNCSFCKLSFQEYPLKSVDIEQIKKIIDQVDEYGMKEIRIKGTNVSQYGYDLYHEFRLPEIIEYAEKKENIERIKFVGFSFKDAIENGFAEVIRDSKKACRFCGSLESGSNRLLELIRKGFTREEFIEFTEQIRKKYPKELHLNVISGFPTETKTDILETLEVLERIDPIEVVLCRYTNSSFVDSNNYPQLTPKQIEEHTRIYQKVLKRRNINTQVMGNGYIYNK